MKFESIYFSFGETVDYDTADRILTGAGILMEKQGYEYSRAEHPNKTAHTVQDMVSHGKNHMEHISLNANVDKNYKDDEIKIEGVKNVLNGSSQANLSSELAHFKDALEEERDNVLDN